jgi:hypothetical protein
MPHSLVHILGLGSMSGPQENSEKFNKIITQPLKKVPILRWLSSTSQARYRAFLMSYQVSKKYSSIYEAFFKYFQSISEELMKHFK